MFRQSIERFAAGAALPAQAIQGLSPEDLHAHPIPGTWSVQQLVIHLMDSDLVGCDRIKRVIAMEAPLLIGYDQNAFDRELHYDELDVSTACEAFRLNRLMTAAVLRRLPETASARWGVHSERGKVTLLEFVEGYANHLDHHLKFLLEKRRVLGK
jgi:uncharacterized damage-inducible protein DinB